MAAPGSIDPYTAPSNPETIEASGDHDWHIEGIGIMVRNGTILPSIDLESGIESPGLVPVKRKCTKPHWVLSLLGFSWFGFQLLPKDWARTSGYPLWLPFALYTGVLVLLASAARLLGKKVIFHIHADPARERARNRRRQIQMTLYLLSIGAVVFPLLLVFTSHSSPVEQIVFPCITSGVAGMLAVSVWQYLDRPRIRMSMENDGWIRLGGVHLYALAKLRRMRNLRSR